jgi:hypothetical protein
MRRQTTSLLTWGTFIALAIVAIIRLWPDRDVEKTPPPTPKSAANGTANQHDALPSHPQGLASPAGSIPSRQPGLAVASAAAHLRFQAPPSATIGEAFDYFVTIDAQQAVGRLTIEVSYDPTRLRARSAEEIDYSNRPPEDGRFSTEETSDGRVVVALIRDAARPMLGSLRMAVVQFEALAPGAAQISVSRISAADGTGGALSFDASDRQSVVDVN